MPIWAFQTAFGEFRPPATGSTARIHCAVIGPILTTNFSLFATWQTSRNRATFATRRNCFPRTHPVSSATRGGRPRPALAFPLVRLCSLVILGGSKPTRVQFAGQSMQDLKVKNKLLLHRGRQS